MILPYKEKFAKLDNPKLPSLEKNYAELSQLTLPNLVEKVVPTDQLNYTLCSSGNIPEVKTSTPQPKSSFLPTLDFCFQF